MSFFEQLREKNILEDWTPIFDWLFDGIRANEFKRRSSEEKKSGMEKIKKLPYFIEDNWIVTTGQKQTWKETQKDNFCVKMVGRNSDGETLIRHIRNGIAHGLCSIIEYYDEDMLEIFDYETDERKVQTAYIWLPLNAIMDLFNIYNEKLDEMREAS